MAINKEVENTLGTIDYLRAKAYDKLIETLAKNLDNMDKQQLLNIFNEFVQDIKFQGKELVGGILETGNESLAMGYAHATRNHIERVDKTIDNELIKMNSQQTSLNSTSELGTLFK